MSRMHGGQKGFTLIELLVVIAILGVIAAVVALNIAGFFGRGTLQAAKTEVHQAQTAIITMMADAESNRVQVDGGGATVGWAGAEAVVYICIGDGVTPVTGTKGVNYFDAADYIYGPLRAEYTVVAWASNVTNPGALTAGNSQIAGGWGDTIAWDYCVMNWALDSALAPECRTP